MRNKDTTITIKISSADKGKIRERMKSAGVNNLSAYLIKMALNGYIIQLDLSDVKEVLRLLRINSNNLNQYAKKANSIGVVYREDIKILQQQQEDIWNEMREIATRLSNI
ncbi:plasmid mobilization protein [Pseudobutyrivibrio sp.]|uniref:plasmid mobilization protein n=1 Tax=Pseudobutyrivibrio sp. TaxID=2014367 RepID=UPI001B3FAA00|nr:plasmid mobilization relaxosome protein MobC [Pseudobutyrivibrio sp.]MBP3261203.1 plasmid mobilization relaxosome protein MobC [Pseudobutyrivibrio sp.]